MNKRIRKKKSKRLSEIIQEINVLAIASGRLVVDDELNILSGQLYRAPGTNDIDAKAIKRVKKSLDKIPPSM